MRNRLVLVFDIWSVASDGVLKSNEIVCSVKKRVLLVV